MLRPLAGATELLTAEDRPTGSAVYWLLNKLITDLAVVPGESSVATDLKEAITSKLKKRFGLDDQGLPTLETCKDNPLLIAMGLDPRYKSLRALPVACQESITGQIQSLLDEVCNYIFHCFITA